MYDLAICDDCETDCLRLEGILSRTVHSNQFRIHIYKDAESLLDGMKDVLFSLIFLDIQMSGMCGKTASEKIREIDQCVILVFYTGYEEPSSTTFNVRPFHYIKKEMDDESISSIVSMCIDHMMHEKKTPEVLAHAGRDKLILKADDIVFIEKCKRGSRVHLAPRARSFYKLNEDDQVYVSDKLSDIYKKLKPYGFGYPHGSYIINFKYMLRFDNQTFNLNWEKSSFNIARSKAEEFINLRDQFYLRKY